ncbi:hypothetical protein F4782DRAFT_255615 [Xylaria castorea]|nr:hypothetical protein F4782DRAFT_255615 [Xylaria castorea]
MNATPRWTELIRKSERRNMDRGESSQNVEDNVETPLLLRHLDSKTPLWQYDNAWIRLPVQYIRWIWFGLGHIFLTWIWPVLRWIWTHRVHVVFSSLLLVFGVLLSISTSRGDFSPGLLIIESFTAIFWATYSAIIRQNRGQG